MNITIHRGTHEIGGSCVEIRTRQAKILLDLGLPLDFDSRPQEQQEQIRREALEWTQDADAIFISHYHADAKSLQSIVRHVDPGLLIPIHTTVPERFATLFPDRTIRCPQDNEPIEL